MRLITFSFILAVAFLLAVGSVPPVHGHALVDNPSGSFELPWANEQVKRSFATGVFNTMGLRVDNDPSMAAVSCRDGVSIIEGIALTFDVRNRFAVAFL